MERPINFFAKCKLINPSGKPVIVNKIILVSPKSSPSDVKNYIKRWIDTYLEKGYTKPSIDTHR